MKTLQLYDTLTRTVHPVRPSDGQTLRFYCCGPTVYGPAHIGNFRSFLVQDLFRRVVEEACGLPTKHVRNVTDVDDKTIRDAQQAGQPLREFTARWLHRFHADCRALGMLEPHVEPGAVDHIPEQITLIERLLAKRHAYASGDGSVYFSVASFPAYGRLSRLDSRELKTGASGNDADEYDKDSAADFVLWKARKPEDGDNFWRSPWGEGRPGWHLECSAMGLKYLGDSFDIHSGGVDLCFPHHENEIAQSDAATGQPFARHWFHIEHLLVDGTKMSKSLGNLYTLDDLKQKGFTAAELRYALLAGHYRQKLNFSLDRLQEARLNLKRIAAARARLPEDGPAAPLEPVIDALLNDLNTPAALGKLFTAIKAIENGEPAAPATFDQIVRIFGWELPVPDAAAEIPAEIHALAAERWEAKSAKDWQRSDALRDQIAAAGFAVKDTKDGYTVAPAAG